MAAPARRHPDPAVEPPRLRPRPRAVAPDGRPADVGAHAAARGGEGEVHRLRARLAEAFTSPRRTSLELALIKALVIAGACIGLWTAIVGGGDLLLGPPR